MVGDADVEEVVDGENGVLAGLKPGGVIAVHSTVHPKTCHGLAKKAAAQGVSVIDAPVSGGGPAVAEGRLLVMVGGDADVVERCRPVFETYADPIVHLGELGSGQTTKLLNNLLFTANLGTAATTLALGECARRRYPTASPKSISRGSGNSFALNATWRDTGGLDRLAGLAGALLQKDVRLVADVADAGDRSGGGCARRRRRRRCPSWNIRGESRIHRRRTDGPADGRSTRRWPVTRSACSADLTEKRSAIAELGADAVDEIVAVCADAEAVMLCVFTDEQVRRDLPGRRPGRGDAGRLDPGAAHHRKPPHRQRPSPRSLRRAACRWWTRRSAAARTTRRPGR